MTAILPLAPAVAAVLRTAAVLPESEGPYLALMVSGFAVGIVGHVFRLRWMVGLGILMIFLATLLLPLAVNVLNEAPDPPGPDVPIDPSGQG